MCRVRCAVHSFTVIVCLRTLNFHTPLRCCTCLKTFGYGYQDTNGLNHGPVWKIQSFLEICTVIPSEPPTQRVRSASRKKSLRGSSSSGKFARQTCRDYIKGKCTKSPCDYWHPPECQFHKTESGCRFGDKCSFAHRQVEGQPNKIPKKDGDKSAVAFCKVHDSWVAYFRTQSRRNLYRF